MRFMISDNKIHPKCWTVTKIEDTFPRGTVKVTLAQDYYDDIHDNPEIEVCNYYDSNIEPVESDKVKRLNSRLKCSGLKKELLMGGSSRTITATVSDEEGNPTDTFVEWHFTFENLDVDEILENFNMSFNDQHNELTISANKNYDNLGKVIKIEIYDSAQTYYSSTELEVKV